MIAENKIVEVGRADLVGEYVGQTAPKIKKVFDSASGGVLFIDEAYSLIPQSERDFANEAIPTIIQEMENRRNEIVVIFAGYKDLMHNFIGTNPGLQSRISNIIHFEDYSVDELYEIFGMMLNEKDYSLESSCERVLRSHFSKVGTTEHFGNGRYVRKLIEASLYQQATRVMEKIGNRTLEETEMNVVIEADIKNAIQELSELESTQRLILLYTVSIIENISPQDVQFDDKKLLDVFTVSEKGSDWVVCFSETLLSIRHLFDLKVLIESRVDFGQVRNLIIASSMLVLGLGGAVLNIGAITLSGTALSAIVGIILNLILPKAEKAE